MSRFRIVPPAPEETEGPQFGVVPYRMVEDRVVFLMITSRRSANWVFPKGSKIKGLGPQDTAAQEAFEEAGIRGEIEPDALGTYYNPGNDAEQTLTEIHLYPMLVTEQLDDWPEKQQRFRHWALLPEVRKLMANKQAAALARDLQRRILFGTGT